MGLLGDIGAGLGVIDPVGAIGTALSGISSITSAVGANQANQVQQGIANQANQTIQQQNLASDQLAQENIAMQEDFAQNGISWRVADAAKNGISPLAALGATEPSFSPVTEINAPPVTPSYQSPISAASAGIGEMGQNLSRALTASQSPMQKAADSLSLAHMAKENDLLDVQIANAKKSLAFQPGTPSGVPGNSWTTLRNADGTVGIYPAEGVNTHSETFGPLLWSVHNGLMPTAEDLGTNLISHGAYGGGSDSDSVNENYR